MRTSAWVEPDWMASFPVALGSGVLGWSTASASCRAPLEEASSWSMVAFRVAASRSGPLSPLSSVSWRSRSDAAEASPLPSGATAVVPVESTDGAIDSDAETLAKFIGAVAKGWGWVRGNPQEAVKTMVGAYPEMDLGWEQKTIDLILKLSFDENTAAEGWGTFSPDSLDSQLSLLDKVGQYPNGRPKTEDVYTTAILDLTANSRPKLAAPGA